MRRLAAATIFLLAVLSWRPSHADPAGDAKKLFQEGTNAYALGDFAEAIAKYKAAFKIKPEPVFLYNIAQAYRLSNDFEQALFFYKSYLRTAPDAPNRKEVESRITQMDEQLTKQKQTATAPPNGTINPTPEHGQPETTEPPADTGKTKIPDPASVGEGSEEGQTTPAPTLPTSDTGHSRPIYKKWWFWAGIGAVAVGAVAIVAVSGGGGSGAPSTDNGTHKIF